MSLRGQHFMAIEGNDDGTFTCTAQGFVKKDITAERYLCAFQGDKSFSKIVSLDDMAKWTFFNNLNEVEAFVKTFDAPTASVVPFKDPSRGVSVNTVNQSGGVTAGVANGELREDEPRGKIDTSELDAALEEAAAAEKLEPEGGAADLGLYQPDV